jgi:hypothetical protein
MSNKKNDADRPAAEMPLSFGDEAPSDWLGKNIVFRVGKGGEGYIRDKSTGEWKPVDDEVVRADVSLRDFFAAHCLPALIARHRADLPWGNIAPTAYEIADAVMREREKAP